MEISSCYFGRTCFSREALQWLSSDLESLYKFCFWYHEDIWCIQNTNAIVYINNHQVMLIAQKFLTLSLSIPIIPLGSLESIQCLHRANLSKSLLVRQYGYRSSFENITYEFVLASLVVLCMSCSSYLDGLWDGSKWLYYCWLIEFYSISTLVGYLMLNSVFVYI